MLTKKLLSRWISEIDDALCHLSRKHAHLEERVKALEAAKEGAAVQVRRGRPRKNSEATVAPKKRGRKKKNAE